MSLFDPKAYGPALEALIASARAPALGLEAPNENARPLLERLSVAQSFPGPPADEAMAETCLAALWLRQGFGETCHRMVQGLPTPTGNYWHGIYHRRESDFTNSKHWFRRAGAHPILTPLREAVCDLSQKDGTGARVGELAGLEQWDPERFVDACAAARERGGQDEADGVDYHFRPPAKIEALGRKEGYVKVDVRGDLQALEIASIQRAMDAGYDAFFEGNPFVPAKLREAGVPERFETLSVFLAPLSRDEINFLTAPERRVDLGAFVTDVQRRKLLHRTRRQKGNLSLKDLENIEKRAGSALVEMREAWKFDHVIALHDGEGNDNWDAFYYPIGSARAALTAFVALLQDETPAGVERWEAGLVP